MKQPILVPAGTGATYRSPVDEVKFLVTGQETGGAFFMAEVSVPPGAGNPPHIHRREEEFFYIQQGTLTVQVGGKTLTVSSGDFVGLPRGVAHSFQNTGKVEAKLLLLAVPAGLERLFAEAFYPAADCPDAPSMSEAFMARLLAAASKCGVEFLPPNPPQD
jgi:quercetin dioxygenase-like cupin family protein